MKRWYRSTMAKAVAFLLCLLSLAALAASVIGAVCLIDYEFYTRPAEYVWEEHVYYKLWSDARDAMVHSINLQESSYDSSYYYYSGYAFDADVTNVRYQILAPSGSLYDTNIVGTPTASFDYEFRVAVWYEYTTLGHYDGLRVELLSENEVTDRAVYTVRMYLEPDLPVADDYALTRTLISLGHALRFWIYPLGAIALLMLVSCLILLIAVSGRRPDTEALVPGPLHRVPFDLLLGATVLLFVFLGYLMDAWYTGELVLLISQVSWVVLAVIAALGLTMSVSARVKDGTLLTNTVAWRLIRLAFRLICAVGRGLLTLCRSIPILWRTALLVLGLGAFDVVAVALAWDVPGLALIMVLFEFVAVSALSLYSAWVMRRLKRAGQELAGGRLSAQVDTKGMLWDFKCHGENLNSIGDGMSRAVEERLRSERMKAELITNVSHDIKTPLTSIINYADLIVSTPCESSEHREYAEVLTRKSLHLKRLLEDLVEVSKANTGNLEIDLTPCDAGVLLTQAAGEFEEKCKAADLTLVTAKPETPVQIMADSRRIWRVFENLMSNACKYSLPGSRVYLTLQVQDGEAHLCFRNTSRAALNVSPDELMERFVRGDASRTTEGNGLGLSIARSLTELQGGKMDLSIDGDLFKVTLRFPLANSPENPPEKA